MVDSRDEKGGGNNASTGSSATAGTIPSAPTGRKNDNEGGTSPPSHPTSLKSSSSPLSASDRASEFVRTIPIDVAYSTALRFLVWGCPTCGRASPSPRGDVAHDEDDVDDDDGPALLILPPDDPTSRRRGPDRLSTSSLERGLYDLSFERLRAMYDPLLIALTSAYPGFLPALFVNMVDSILCLEGARHDRTCARVSRDGRRQHRRSEDDGGYEGGGGDGTAVELYDVGDRSDKQDGTLDLKRLEHHVQYMSRWVRYVLSRAFHMHFDKSVATWSIPEDGGGDVGLVVPLEQHHSVEPSLPRAQQERLEPASNEETNSPQNQQQQQRQPIDLKKRGRKKWTAAQHLYMQGPLDFSYLYERVGMPLNSVCDRLLLFRQQHEDYSSATMPCSGGGSKIDGGSTLLASSSSSNNTQVAATATSTVVGQLHEFLENVIGKKERVIFMGIYDDINDQHKMGTEWQRSSEVAQRPDNVDDDSITKEEKKETEEEEEESKHGEGSSPPPAKVQNLLSLEEMEAIFEGDDHTMTDVDNGAPPLLTHSPNIGNADNSSGGRINHHSIIHIKPWTLCKGWDACAIGTLPGYPS
ncbi:hypothetical protein ACHAW5_009349 [Stephanodiscus triporus]|uniref:Uncharacterized protein n=1 Tax=Stephanodiscus triporus TaxID=2934178 RepID=A0ABD3N8F0_9STRA